MRFFTPKKWYKSEITPKGAGFPKPPKKARLIKNWNHPKSPSKAVTSGGFQHNKPQISPKVDRWQMKRPYKEYGASRDVTVLFCLGKFSGRSEFFCHISQTIPVSQVGNVDVICLFRNGIHINFIRHQINTFEIRTTNSKLRLRFFGFVQREHKGIRWACKWCGRGAFRTVDSNTFWACPYTCRKQCAAWHVGGCVSYIDRARKQGFEIAVRSPRRPPAHFQRRYLFWAETPQKKERALALSVSR